MLLEIIPWFQFTDLTSVASEVLHNAIYKAQEERITQFCKLAVVITDQQWADLVVRGMGIDIGCSSPDPLIVNKYYTCFGSLDVRRWAGYTFLIDNRLFDDIHRAADNLICAEWVARNCRPSDADRLFKEVATCAAGASVVTPERPVAHTDSLVSVIPPDPDSDLIGIGPNECAPLSKNFADDVARRGVIISNATGFTKDR